MSEFVSWGHYPKVDQIGLAHNSRLADLPIVDNSFLPFGCGRSYGDSCLNAQGVVLSSKSLNHFITFDEATGVLEAEAGVTLNEIIQLALPKGWFLPVTPGTSFVTLAGAVANDVHGKNHHHSGSFGNHVLSFELLRSDGTRLQCSDSENQQWFYATIGGLGLTGFITKVVIQLKAVSSVQMDSETIKYEHLQDFFTLSEDSSEFEYTVAWLDCSAKGSKLGRGLFNRANHVQGDGGEVELLNNRKLSVPITPPISCINQLSVKAFNQLYYHRQQAKLVKEQQYFDGFFYPLDGILHWNRLYGKKGFVQYQCLIPNDNAQEAIKALLECISYSGQGSFLVVLKMMGDIASKGLLSFSQAGATLAIDFPFLGQKTLALMGQLDAIVIAAKGRLYPAKDARMSKEFFQQAYPNWCKLEDLRDPNIQSDFWRRVADSKIG